MIEEWKDITIPEFSDYYSVSNKGRVYSKRSGKVLSPKFSTDGYCRVTLSVNGFQKTIGIHRLVALAFIPNPYEKPTVNHINEEKTDNTVFNLEWATVSEQNMHGTRTIRAKMHTDYKSRKIDYESVARKHDYTSKNMCNRKSVTVIFANEIITRKEYQTQRDAAKDCGVSCSTMSNILNGKRKQRKEFFAAWTDEFQNHSE